MSPRSLLHTVQWLHETPLKVCTIIHLINSLFIDNRFGGSLLLFSRSVMSNSLQPHGLQHARPPCPSPSPGVCSNSCPWVSDAIQPSHPLSSLSPAFNLSQCQSLFQWVSSSHQVAKVLEFQLQHQSFHWIFRIWFPLGLIGLISLQSMVLESSPTS